MGTTIEHVRDGTPEEDSERNTDVVASFVCSVFGRAEVSVSCRMRGPGYYPTYKGDFTIRHSRPSGAATEIDKIIAGHGERMLYCFATHGEQPGTWGNSIAAYGFADLNVFRLHEPNVRWKFGKEAADGVKWRIYRWHDFPPAFLITSLNLPKRPPQTGILF